MGSLRYSVGIPTTSTIMPSTHRFQRHVIRAKVEPSEKSVEIMRKFSEQYARRSGTYFCVDKGVTSVVIKGLADHKDSLGAPLCPCRHYDDKAAEAGQGFWNCPCVPMRERKECHCMLFLTPDNDFAGQEQTISLEEIKESTKNMWPTTVLNSLWNFFYLYVCLYHNDRMSLHCFYSPDFLHFIFLLRGQQDAVRPELVIPIVWFTRMTTRIECRLVFFILSGCSWENSPVAHEG